MSAGVFQSAGLSLRSGALPPIRMAAGRAVLWRVRNDHHAHEALDAVTGLVRAERGAVVWFGEETADMSMKALMGLLHRLAPLSEDGGLIGNINLCENILLPRVERHAHAVGDPLGELEGLLSSAPWSAWLAASDLTALPHRLSDPRRALAGLLRAYLCRPEAIVAANIFGRLDEHERPPVEQAAAWVRRQLPDCAWLFLSPERSLPPGFEESNLGKMA
jgi:hypothetical protein